MSTFDKLMLFLGLGCTALNTVALSNPTAVPLWLSLVVSFIGAGAMGITKITGVNVAPRPGTNAQ